jgi:ribonuclease HII
VGRPTHGALDRSRVTELYAFDEKICSLVASGLVPDGQRPSSEAPTAEHAKEKTSKTNCDTTGLTIAGFDEAGRGALAGPVVVGCVHFPFVASGLDPHVKLAGLDDSKRLSPQKREELYKRIYTLAKWGIGCASPAEIDRLGIVSALTLAAKRAYRAMGWEVPLLLLDRGLSLREHHSSKASTAEHSHKKERFLCRLSDPRSEMKRPSLARCDATEWPFEIAFTKGDTKSLHIAAASILAKVSRDQMMARIHVRFPGYGFDSNKGYGTAGHLAALRRLGPSPFHRTSFRLG